MASKSSSVRSIRLQNELWSWLAEEAARRSATVNGLVGDLLIVGRLKAEETQAVAASKPAEKPAKTTARAAPERPGFKSRLKGEWKAP